MADTIAITAQSVAAGLALLGCGEGCSDQARMHEFNYFHPNWHPFYQGRDVYTLQSVTKSVAATVIGIALGRGGLGSLVRTAVVDH